MNPTVKKEYVSILAQIRRDGSIQPLGILLEDGWKYDIDEVKDKCRAASLKAGGIHYTLQDAIEEIRGRFGKRAITNAIVLGDLKMPDDGRDTVKMPGLMFQ